MYFNSFHFLFRYYEDDNQIELSISNDVLKITNTSLNTIYFFAVEQECAARINWTPHFDEPNIKGGKSSIMELSTISNCEEGTVKPGNKIIVYYWKKLSDESAEIKSKIIEI